MRKISDNDKRDGKHQQGGVISKTRTSISSALEDIKSDAGSLKRDLIIFAVGFLLARCRLWFGARPVGIAFVAMMTEGIWPALSGVIIGSGSLGAEGIIYLMATVITLLLRMAASSSERRERREGELFCESLTLRVSISVISGFIVAVYEAIVRELTEATLLYGLAMIIITPLITLSLSGICYGKNRIDSILYPKREDFIISACEKNEKNRRMYFQFSSLALIFFISLSFKDVNILGISLSYVFTSLVTLITAKRLGTLRAMAVGLIAALPVSIELAVAFALVGLCSGAILSFGVGYGIVAGGAALCLWSAYVSDMSALLSSLPEYVIASAIAVPILGKTNEESKDGEDKETSKESSTDMVGTMALSYQRDFSGSVNNLEATLIRLSGILRKYSSAPIPLSKEEYRALLIEQAEDGCIRCEKRGECTKTGIRTVIKAIDGMTEKLACGKKITADDLRFEDEVCYMASSISERINCEASRREWESYLQSGLGGYADEYEIIARLIGQAIERDDVEITVDNSMTEDLTRAFEGCGFKNGTIRAFGKHRQHFILAGEDESGRMISSFQLRRSIEDAAGVKLGASEYFRKGKMALMECGIRPSYKLSYATVSEAGSKNEISGDTSICFESSGGYFYSLISDGMGSGGLAKQTSLFVSEFIKEAVEIGAGKESLILLLNNSIRMRREECSATVDLFEFDMLKGGGVFIKSGAPPSYIKRGSSIFRIRSQTAPIGLMRSIDTEKIAVEIKKGDYVIMFSDGVAEIAEDAPWLLVLLGEAPREDLKEYASLILSEAKKNGTSGDDMTVTVILVGDV